MLLNGAEIPILLGLAFRHNLNDPPANISALTWHLLSLLLFPARSVGDSNFSLGVMNSILKEWPVFILRNDIPVDEPSTFFPLTTLNCMLCWQHFYPWKYPSHLKKKTTKKQPTQTVQSQIVVLFHALVPSMKVKQTNEQLFITWWHLEASVSWKRSSILLSFLS